MNKRATFSLDEENYDFLTQVSGANKSAYINELLSKAKIKSLEDAMLKANQEEAEDAAYQTELADWDVTLSDGLAG